MQEKDIYNYPLLLKAKDKAAEYGVAASLLDYKVGMKRADSGYYLVAGLGEIPAFNNPANIERQMKRNDDLFYPKAFAKKITPDNANAVIAELAYYCSRAEIVSALYKQYDCKIPDVMRVEEVADLMTCNDGYNNRSYMMTLRMDYKKQLDKYFKIEKKTEKSQTMKDYLDYIRSDRYDGDSSDKYKNPHLNSEYRKYRGKQDISMELLMHTNTELYGMSFTEEQYQNMVECMKQYPHITYHSSDKVVYDFGHIDDPYIDPWADQQRHFEYRKVYFKKVDEPYFADAMYKTKFKDAKMDEKVWTYTTSTAEYVPYACSEAFMEEAEKQGLHFTIDTRGKHLMPAFDKVPIVVAGPDKELLDEIIETVSERNISGHAVRNSNLPYLDNAIEKAALKEKEYIPARKPSQKKYVSPNRWDLDY